MSRRAPAPQATRSGQPAATAPLRASRVNTMFRGHFPRTRPTLVAPGLLLPTSKMFTPRERATR